MTAKNILQAIKYLGTSGDSFLDIENYEKYRFSDEKIDCHHRREIDENKTRAQLIEEDKYFNVPASDLIFLTHAGHTALHMKGKNLSGENNPHFGKPHSEEARRKISESERGKTVSSETKKKLSAAKRGEKNPNFGKPLSEEHKRKIAESHKRENLSIESRRKMSEAIKSWWEKRRTAKA